MIRLTDVRPYKADRERPSPNFGARKGGAGIRYIILHATAGSDEGAESWMIDPKSGVSAHLHIRRDGSITRHVDDTSRAWHAGKSSWQGESDLNTVSLGWEIGNRNDGEEPYTDAQYQAVAALLHHYLPQGITREDVLSHALVAPGRKTDPLGWDWKRLWNELDALELTDKLNGREWPDATVIQPPVLPPEAPLGDLNLEPIEVPKEVPRRVAIRPTITRWYHARGWAKEVAERLGVEARDLPNGEDLLDVALVQLYRVAESVVPGWLLIMLWPSIDKAARDALLK